MEEEQRRAAALPKASDVLADELRARILGDGMAPGEALPSEAALMTDYGFSRGTVRETLRLLESDGLIVIKRGPKGGVRVRHPDVRQVSRSLGLLFSARGTNLGDLFTFRKLIEPAAAAEAARTATAEQRALLLDIAPKHYGVQRRFEPSADFHGAIGRCSNNGVYEVMLTALHDALEWHSSDEKLSHDDIEATRRAHVLIAKAINDRDPEVAARRMRRHLEQFERVLASQGRLAEPIVPQQRWRRNPPRTPSR